MIVNYEYKLAELSAILNKSQALISLKLRGQVPWKVDEIKKMYDVLEDDAWDIYQSSLMERKKYLLEKKTRGGNKNVK